MNIHRYRDTVCALFFTSVILAGCAQMTSEPQNPQPVANSSVTMDDSSKAISKQIPDLPIPPGSTMNIENTFIVGSAESWFGQTMIRSPGTGDMIFDFFKQELPGYSWEELSTVRASTSILTYTREHRVLSIQLTERQPGSTEVMITVSPKGGSTGGDDGDLLQPVQ